ncbi:hypothetical protein DFH06DRAFT_1473109 [Mycena polygramma]|nr:hypothetical protein DFH06DRAFT_1473109 [Mycena polygramma]
MEIEGNRRQLRDLPLAATVVPDALPLELWHDIAALIPVPDSHLVPWLSVGPGSVARHMHDAAFAILFRDLRLKLSSGGFIGDVDKALAHLARVLARNEECILAVRRLEIYSICACVQYNAESIDALARGLANALPRFPMLQEFIWDNDEEIELPMHPRILETLLSANKQLQVLQIGAMDPHTPHVDLAGLDQLVSLQVTYSGPPNILFPENLKAVNLLSTMLDGNHPEPLVNNAVSLNEVTFARMVIPSNLWYREPYSALHTIYLLDITPPMDTGLDFSAVATLDTLYLRYIDGVQNIVPWPITCIMTPGNLRNFTLISVSAAWEDSSLLFGVNLLTLDSLDLEFITLTPEDIHQIFVPRWDFNNTAPPLAPQPFQLTHLKLGDDIASVVLASSRLFPALCTLEIRILGHGSVPPIDFFNHLGSFVSGVNTLDKLVIESQNHHVQDAMFGSSSFMSCLRTANNLRHFAFPVNALTLDHPLFHEFGDALLHVREISVSFPDWSNYKDFTEIENGFHALSKFANLTHLYIHTGYRGRAVIIAQSVVENLARRVPSLRMLIEQGVLWEIQRHAITRELQRVVCLNPSVR